MGTAIELRDVHKTFQLPHEVHTTLTERILSGFRGTTYERFEALRGVDLAVEQGEFLGVIGANGCGKSTLLKIISGLLPPDAGEVHVDGTMSALLELGLGFSAELTVRENIELYAAVLGFPRQEAQRRIEDAIEFAGLERFRDAKLKNLSTGMRARLGFATALQAESDILLLDEILAVGDADFQLKCLDVFEQFKLQRRTIVLVTHDLHQVQRFCDRAVLIDQGRVAADGDPDTVIPRYLEKVGRQQVVLSELAGLQRTGDGAGVRVVRAWVEDETGKRVGRVRSGDRLVIAMQYEVLEDVEEPVFGFAIKAEDGTVVYSFNTCWDGARTQRFRAGQTIEARAPMHVALRNGRYLVQAGAAHRDLAGVHDLVDGAAVFVVHGSPARHGWVDLQSRLTYTVGEGGGGEARRGATIHDLPVRGGRR
ncbi:MAG: ABC transporter ATP-binding protein [Deltaproteobacteria bacterium]|nr:ABC transporter ATP-binding protein [Deltaproteobacteria bacterium]